MTIGRFAPTPSGGLHLGNLFCSLLAWLSAKAQGGEIILRIEDLDRERSRREYVMQAEHDLKFLGLNWDRGGTNGGDEYFQSKRTEYYEQCLSRLEELKLCYPCFCTRAELHAVNAPHTSDGEAVYTGKCRNLSDSEIAELKLTRNPAVRLRVPDEVITFTDGHYGEISQNLLTDCGDFILRRSDGAFAYQLAVVADDAAMGVSEVVRGRDLLSSTPRQLYLYRLLGFAAPKFAHTPLILAADGRRLSKRDRDISLAGLIEKGYTAEDIVGRLAFLAGLIDRPESAAANELIPLFSWEKIPTEDICLPRDLF